MYLKERGLILLAHNLKFCSKAILAFNYSITSTFDSTQTDRPASLDLKSTSSCA